MVHQGGTDQLIIEAVLRHHGVPEADIAAGLPRAVESMVAYAGRHAARFSEGLEVLPGVLALLEALARRGGVAVGLVTGNLQPIAWAKMRALGIAHLFTEPRFGGFGSDAKDRGDLVKLAKARALQLGLAGKAPGAQFARAVHVGDTPNDVKAALAGGVLPLAVCTGVFPDAQLREHCGPAEQGELGGVVVPDLGDTERIVGIITGRVP